MCTIYNFSHNLRKSFMVSNSMKLCITKITDELRDEGAYVHKNQTVKYYLRCNIHMLNCIPAVETRDLERTK